MSSTIFKKYIFAVLVISMLFPGTAFAVTAEELQRQIADLRAQITALQSGQNNQGAYQFTRNLYFGLRNDSDVRRLQEFLIFGKYLNITVATGNYFSLTREAVIRYQLKNGLPGTGYFGPLTRAKVNAELAVVKQPEPPRMTVEPPTETPPTEPISTPPEATLPSSFDERVESQTDSAQIYDLNLMERSVHMLINQERLKFGLNELTWDAPIADVGRSHSLDQAGDNGPLTNPDILCHYPLIRHEGIRGGYSLVDRLKDGDIFWRSAGENIVMFSTTKNLIYTYRSDNPPPDCKDVPGFEPGSGTKEERLALFYDVLNQSLAAVSGLPTINWVNKEFRTYEEIGEKAVSLWMNSPGHRANILRAGFNYGGVGIAKINDYLIMTQNFVGR